MAKKPLDFNQQFNADAAAKTIAATWFNYHSDMRPKIEEWKELRNYLFATDTSTTSNRTLPWKNSTTLPKLCQIRDNLHSNYLSALFPNDDWLKWEAYAADANMKKKRTAIQAYMSNKTRESHFRTAMSKLLLDFIDYGNVFGTVDFEASYREDINGKKIVDYIGPKVRRISPLDIVFNPLAESFKDSWKIVRVMRTVGELEELAVNEPDNAYLQNALKNRKELFSWKGMYGIEDIDKQEGFQMDGFGTLGNSYSNYLDSGYVECLYFYGDQYNPETRELRRGRVITVIDRMWVIQDEPIPSWLGSAPIFHAGWRSRPDNLWCMGPLDNLVGMQYRIDHLENLKADAMDLAVLPPLVIAGDVEQFRYAPGEEIHLDEGGTVTELAKNVQWVIQAENNIQALEQRMEMYAGAPREAMGMRTPGEKTMFEVQMLENAASRIFQEKINTYEVEFLEPILNAMLEVARRNLNGSDIIRVMDDDLGVTDFISITKDDITASGKLRPIGARHFAAQAQLMQNLTQVFNTNLGQMLAPHTSAIGLSRVVEDILGVQRFQLFGPNKAVFEQQETQRLINQAHENLGTEQNVSGVLDQAAAQGPASSENIPQQGA